MNPRERVLTLILIAFILLASLGGLGYVLYYKPLQEREARLAGLRKNVKDRTEELQQIQRDLPRLEVWKQLSLPADPDLALREYERFLSESLRESGFEPGKYTIKPQRLAEMKTSAAVQAKGPAYTRLTFQVQAPVALGNLVKFLERFYHTALLHQIRGLTVKRVTGSSTSGELTVDMTIEALLLGTPETRGRPAAYAVTGMGVWAARFGKVAGLGGLADPPRDYAAVAEHNIFLGPQITPRTVDRTHLTSLVFLTDITQGNEAAEAAFNYQYNNKRPRISGEPGDNKFAILEDSRGGTVIEGVVLDMEERELYFRVQFAVPPERSGGGRFRDTERWSRPDKKTLDALVASKVVDADEADRVYQVGREYWDQLDREELVEVRGTDFSFRWDLICGQVVRTDERTVTVLVNDKYCAYASTAAAESRFRRRTEPHEGYFAWHVGDSLDKAMATPLTDEQVKKLLKAATLPTRRNDEARR